MLKIAIVLSVIFVVSKGSMDLGTFHMSTLANCTDFITNYLSSLSEASIKLDTMKQQVQAHRKIMETFLSSAEVIENFVKTEDISKYNGCLALSDKISNSLTSTYEDLFSSKNPNFDILKNEKQKLENLLTFHSKCLEIDESGTGIFGSFMCLRNLLTEAHIVKADIQQKMAVNNKNFWMPVNLEFERKTYEITKEVENCLNA